MIFNDFTVMLGDVFSERVQDTTKLEPQALSVCRKMLKRLRKGEVAAAHGVFGLPNFSVSLGPPEWLREEVGERVEAQGRFFTCAAPGETFPFQINVLLPLFTDAAKIEMERRACATLLALSSPPNSGLELAEEVDLRVDRLMAARPLLATTLMPFGVEEKLVGVAADFSTCFAAIMLLEEE